MSHLRMKAFLLGILFGVAGCHGGPKKNPDNQQSWSGQMQSLDQSLKDMIPVIYDRDEFSNPINEKRILGQIENFSKSVHRVSPEKAKALVGEDPLFNFSLARFRADLEKAKDSFELGHKEYARSVMKSMVGHCFRCHTSTTIGPEFQGGKMDFSGLKINRLEKADLLVASRRYDEALTVLEKIITDKQEGRDFPFEVERAVRRYLSVIIRVRKEPLRAIKFLDELLAQKSVPYYLIEDVRKWRQSLEAWSKSMGKKLAQPDHPIKNAKDMFRKARLAQDFRKDHGGDVEYMVTTGILHDALSGLKKTNDKAEAYFLLGECYEVLGDLGSWNLHEFYFESCIREWPRGPLARKCYQRLEESVYVGYSGSSGVHVPVHEKKRLNEIKNLIDIH